MFRLSREIRFAINRPPDDQLRNPPLNGFGGFPAILGLGHFLTLHVSLAGPTDLQTGCVLNIKDIDRVIRRKTIPMVSDFIHRGEVGCGPLISRIYQDLKDSWPLAVLQELSLFLSPYTAFGIFAPEFPMIRFSQKFEFCASHRLFNPALDDAENQRLFGKCSNPHGHGHNYVLQVTLSGQPDSNGHLVDVPRFERLVSEAVIEPFDHRNLNVELPQFSDLIPTVENIAMVAFRALKPKLELLGVKLAGVTLWESPRTWCEYAE